MDSMPSVNTLFAGRTVFLTGGSGFVGKVVVEKLLRDVPDVAKVFVLVRAAKGKSAQQRWTEISQSVLFNRVRADRPWALEKVVPVEGDITIDDMGLTEADLAAVLEQTSVVLHCAATVRFNDTLRSAIELNVKGVHRMIKLAKRMPKLDCFLHCSTCYVNVDKEGDIDEKLYDVVCDPHKLIDGHSWMSDEMLDGITASVTNKYFNTYCFTKHVAEELVKRECVDLPTLIFRPAIIAGIWKDGIPGWADAFQGITANALGFGTGTIPRMPCDTANPLDVVPVDVVSNMMITCAAYRLHLTAQKNRSLLPVFHCNSSHLNPLAAAHYRDLCGSFLATYPLEMMLASPSAGTRGSPALEDGLHAFKQLVVGPALDKAASLIAGRKPFWARTFAKCREVYQVFIPFTSKRWIYQSNGMVELIERMQPDDRETFDFDLRQLDWTDYISDVLFGMKTFLTKNDIMSDEKLAGARRKVKIHQGIELAGTLLFAWLLSVALTGGLASWSVALPLALVLYAYFNCALHTTVRIGTIDSYRKRMCAEMRAELPGDKCRAA